MCSVLDFLTQPVALRAILGFGRLDVVDVFAEGAEGGEAGAVELPVEHLRVVLDDVLLDRLPHERRVRVQRPAKTR